MALEAELLTIKEVRELLKCSRSNVYRLIDKGELPIVKVGRRYTRLKKSDVLAFIERNYGTRGRD